jgi:16S rRNA (uracil1498-N3)-methyltransferase
MAGYRSFLFPEAELGSDYALLDARESHHLVRVFRAQAGDAVELLDGKGRCYSGRIAEAKAKQVRVAIESLHEHVRKQPAVTLVQAVPKGKTMDLILRMASELGAAAIQPIFTAQGEVQIPKDRLRSKLDKWHLTMVEACKQCGLPWLPELRAPLDFSAWIKTAPSPSNAALRLVASLADGSRPLLEMLEAKRSGLTAIEAAVGPEGDFSAEEYQQLDRAGWLPVRLGANVLRAETAAAYVLSVIDQGIGS